MTTANAEQVLNRAFVRAHRSLGQYLRTTAWPRFDIGDEHALRTLVDKEARLTDKLAEYLIRQTGTVETGHYTLTYSDLHFLNFSRILPEWRKAQSALVEDLIQDRRDLGDAEPEAISHLDQLIQHEKNILAKLEGAPDEH